MERQQHIENLLEHYEKPRYRGSIADADVVLEGANPSCGDVVTIYLKIDGDDRVQLAQFEGQGCTISQAAALLFCWRECRAKPLLKLRPSTIMT
jgi:nitrogen fixation NifU-like protein